MNEPSLWNPEPSAADLIEVLLEDLVSRANWLAQFREQLRSETGTRLFDWVDHLAVPHEMNWEGESIEARLQSRGFQAQELPDRCVWGHPGALLPKVELTQRAFRVALKVESVVDFSVANRLPYSPEIGPINALRRQRLLHESTDVELWVVERQGELGWYEPAVRLADWQGWCDWSERVLVRDRGGEEWERGFEVANQLIDEGIERFGVDATCSRFFWAERAYWQAHNRAGQLQKLRQDRLGLGWANHDHHTYRSSRTCFRSLMATLAKLCFQRRERFYAGRDAGWGAQVLEQSAAGITVFADVDLSPEELQGDFATEGLATSQRLGTVGLWCALHGEAFLGAGMHHLECQFDFDQARSQLNQLGIGSMPPFTNFDYLKQCFTVGERWPVSASRVEKLVALGQLTQQQADQFLKDGVVGSHLEILERNDGFKGFNQTGISDIILRTDPRRIEPK